jgi:hypothetical protein
VGLVLGNAPWYRGALITQALKACPHRYSPQLQVIERFWRVWRRRATHTQPLLTLAQLKHALRHSLCSYQTLKYRVLSVIQAPKKRTQLSTA